MTRKDYEVLARLLGEHRNPDGSFRKELIFALIRRFEADSPTFKGFKFVLAVKAAYQDANAPLETKVPSTT